MTDKLPTSGVAAVQHFMAEARVVHEPRPQPRLFRGDPKPGDSLDGVAPGQWTPDDLGLPPGCPVIPLGVEGDVNWFLDTIGQLHRYEPPFSQSKTLTLFRGRHNWVKWAWPRWEASGPKDAKEFAVVGWKDEVVREALLDAATAKGPWSAVEKVRGRGCWRDAQDRLVIHCGDTIFLPDASGRHTKGQPPGELHGCVYPTRAPLKRPWFAAIDDARNPARLLRPLLGSWSWSRPHVDPHLLLGWIGCAFLGPAIEWRSNVYLTGDAGMGKSTLQSLVKHVLGDWLVQTANTTAAGIYQHVGQDGLAVAVDEFEGEAENGHAKRVLKLARQASSGAQGLRGGDRGTGSEFCIRSAFLFSSINTPPLEPQDLSRFALLKLQRLAPGAAALALNAESLGIMGRTILARLARQFPRYQQTLDAFRAELGRAGMDARGRDTFGTLLACADLIEHDAWDEARLRVPVDGDLVPWAELLEVGRMHEFEDRAENWRACLDRLLSVPVEAWRNGTKWTVGQVVESWHKGDDSDFGGDVVKVRRLLGQAGLGLAKRGKEGGGDWLAVPNQNPILQRLYDGSKWYGEPGAGVWSGALRQSPRGDMHEVDDGMRINGVKSRCTLIRLDALYGPGGIMTSTAKPPAAGTGEAT